MQRRRSIAMPQMVASCLHLTAHRDFWFRRFNIGVAPDFRVDELLYGGFRLWLRQGSRFVRLPGDRTKSVRSNHWFTVRLACAGVVLGPATPGCTGGGGIGTGLKIPPITPAEPHPGTPEG